MRFYIFFFFLIIVGFVPYFGSIDIIGPQWLYLSLLSITSIFFSYKGYNFNLIKFKPFLFYLVFVFFCLLSLFYTLNISISLVDLSRILVSFILVFNFLILVKTYKPSLKIISLLVVFVLFLELIFSFYPLFIFLLDNDFSTIDFSTVPNALKGVSGNKNVMASNVSFKIPFVIYLISINKKYISIFSSFVLSLAIINIYLLSSRATFISLSLSSILFLIYFIYNFKAYSKKSFLLLIVPYFFLYSLITYTSSESISLSSRISSISSTDTSTSYRVTLYENAIDYISKSPFIGCGIGNWKVESLPYWKSLLTGYLFLIMHTMTFLNFQQKLAYLVAYLIYLFFFLSSFHPYIL